MDKLFQFNPQQRIEETAIPAGALSGIGIFTTFLSIPKSSSFNLEAHYQRLLEGCRFMGSQSPWTSFNDFETMLSKVPEAYLLQPQVIRVTCLRQEGFFKNEGVLLPPIVYISLRPVPQPIKEGIRLCLTQFDRQFPEVKHTSQLAESIHLEKAQQLGFQDYLRISSQGLLTESAYANLFLIQHDKTLVTPSVSSGCLPGTMRQSILEICQTIGLEVKETQLTPTDLETMTGGFLTNAVRGPYPICQIQDHLFNPENTWRIVSTLRNYLPLHKTI